MGLYHRHVYSVEGAQSGPLFLLRTEFRFPDIGHRSALQKNDPEAIFQQFSLVRPCYPSWLSFFGGDKFSHYLLQRASCVPAKVFFFVAKELLGLALALSHGKVKKSGFPLSKSTWKKNAPWNHSLNKKQGLFQTRRATINALVKLCQKYAFNERKCVRNQNAIWDITFWKKKLLLHYIC